MPQTRCHRCHELTNQADMFYGPECDRCRCVRISVARSRNIGGPVPASHIKGLSLHRSRWVFSQVRKRRCADCGARLCVHSWYVPDTARIVSLSCLTSHDSHSWIGLIDVRGRLIEIYSWGEWAFVGRPSDPDEIPF